MYNVTEVENGAYPVVEKEPGLFDDVGDDDDTEGNQGLQISDVLLLSSPGEHQPLNMSNSEHQNTPSNSDSITTSMPACKEQVPNKKGSNSSQECQQADKQLATKLCKNIARIVGETDDVQQLDQARKDLKCHPTSDFYNDKYQNLLVQMQTKILAQHTSLKKEHNNWEKEYCFKHDFHEPNLSDVKQDKRQYSIYKKIILCEELLKVWNITVHL